MLYPAISNYQNHNKNSFNFSDAILGELCALESHFPTSSSTSTASSTTSSTGTVLQRGSNCQENQTNDQNHNDHPNHEDLLQQEVPQPAPPPPPPLMMSSQENIQKYLLSAEPQYITAESVRQNKLLSNSGELKTRV